MDALKLKVFIPTFFSLCAVTLQAQQVAVPFNSHHALMVYKQIKALKASRAKKLMAVFDLDDTLIDTRYRTAAIIRSCVRDGIDNAYKEALKPYKVQNLSIPSIQYNMADTFDSFEGARFNIPGYDLMIHQLEECWRQKFFHPDYLSLDRAFEGAAQWLHFLNGLGVKIFYLSARPKSLQEATLKSLKDLGFPTLARGSAYLELKPLNEKGSTSAWKKGRLWFYGASEYRLVTVFENDPENIKAMKSVHKKEDGLCYRAPYFFIDSIREWQNEYPEQEEDRLRPQTPVLSQFWTQKTQGFCESYFSEAHL